MGFRPRDPKIEIEREVQHHIEDCAQQLIDRGMPADAAWAEARRRFGDAASVRRELEEIAVEGRFREMAAETVRSLAADVRVALRSLRRRPGFAIAVVATLTLGIGAATSIFSVLDAVLLRPLAYRNADRWTEVMRGPAGQAQMSFEVDFFQKWRDVGDSFADSWVGFTMQSFVRTDGERAEPLDGLAITPGAIEALGVPVLLGRGFTDSDAVPGGPHVVILTQRYWDRLGRPDDILGHTIGLDTGPATVVGILGGGVRFPEYGRGRDIWIPMRSDFTAAGRDVGFIQGAWALRRAGMTVEAAQERADAAAAALQEAKPTERGWPVVLEPIGRFRAQGELAQGLWVLSGTVTLLLLIAVVNGVNLLLVRATTRAREFAVRASLGCSKARLTRQLLVEGAVLGLGGALGAVALAWFGVRALGPILPSSLLFRSPYAVAVEGRTLVFAFASALAAGAVLGLVPSLAGVRMDALSAGRGGGETPRHRRARKGLVAAQIALSLTLLAIAGLLARSLGTLMQVDTGFEVERIAVLEFQLPRERYPSGAERADFIARLEERIRSSALVESVAVSSGGGFMFGNAIEAEDGAVPESQPYMIPNTHVTGSYIPTLGLELMEGRGFTPADAARGKEVAVVDRDLSHFLWGDAPAVGRRFRVGDAPWVEVIGVVRELRLMGRDQRQGPHQILFPVPESGPGSYMHVSIRTPGDPSALLALAREAVADIDPWLPIIGLRTASDVLAEEEALPRFMLLLMSLLAAAAVVLASVGLYGVLSYAVRTRERELGVRMALGADRRGVMGLVLGDGFRITATGIALGLVGAAASARLVESLLYEVGPRDPWALAGSAALFLAVALAASYVPARRATGIHPADALRAE